MENSISEEEKKDEDTPEKTGGNWVPQSLFKKTLPWGVFALLVILSVAFMRMAFPEDVYEESFALYNASNFSIPHFIGCLVRLGFSLVWMGLFFALLRRPWFCVRGIILVLFFWPVPFALYLQKYYGMEIDSSFVMDCMNTHWQEARAFISFHAIATLLAFVVAMLAVAWLIGLIKTKLLRTKSILYLLLALAFLVLSLLPYPRNYIFPLKASREVGESIQLYKESELGFEQLAKQESEPQEAERVPAEISHVNAVPIVVLHIGESARADHAPFNGYSRNTMPNMLREYESGNLVSFPKCVSFSVRTVFSMLGMMSPSTVLDNAFRHPTFIPALNQNKVETCGFLSQLWTNGIHDVWVDVMLGRMQEIVSSRTSALALLPEIREKLAEDAKKTPPQERFYLYYGEGSHAPFTHYDYDRHSIFKPTGDRIYNDERDVNNYDNTFVATDEFCEGFIDALRNENAVYIFVGDHGTMLGEDGLQGRPYRRPESRHVLFFVWASEKFKAENPELWATLLRNRERLGVISHDFVYNSVLHLFSLKTPFYDGKADLFSDSAEPFPTEMPEAESFGPMRFGENAPLHIKVFE